MANTLYKWERILIDANKLFGYLKVLISHIYMVEGDEVSVWLQISATYTTHLKLGLSSTGLGKNDRLSLVRYPQKERIQRIFSCSFAYWIIVV
jgi:hypothetical protein